MSIILVRHGTALSNEVDSQEAKRVGEKVQRCCLRNMSSTSLKTAHIITSKHVRTQQTALGIAEVNGIPVGNITQDERVYEEHPLLSNAWTTSPEIVGALTMIREKIAVIGADTPLIIVAHLPSVWGIMSQISPGELSSYEKVNWERVHGQIVAGWTSFIKEPKL